MPPNSNPAYSSRPALKVGGRILARVSEALRSLTLEEQQGGLSTLEVRLSNVRSLESGETEPAFDARDPLYLGASVELGGGDETEPYLLFQGTVTAVGERWSSDGAPEFVVLAEDALQKARMKRRTRIWNNTRLDDVVQQVAEQAGLRPNVQDLSTDLGTQVQLDESDLAFLRRLLDRVDGELQVIEGELHAMPASSVSRGEVELNVIGEVRSLEVMADLAHQVTQTTLSGWDEAQGERISVTSEPGDLGPGEGSTGASLLQSALGSRSEHLSHISVRNRGEAQAVADTAHRKRARSFVRVEATTSGNPQIRVGTRIRLSGVGMRFRNTYQVVRACHRFDLSSGYETDFEAECAYLGDAS